VSGLHPLSAKAVSQFPEYWVIGLCTFAGSAVMEIWALVNSLPALKLMNVQLPCAKRRAFKNVLRLPK